MDDSVMPVRNIVGLTIIGQEFGFFLLLEDYQRQAPSGAVDSLAGDLQTPTACLLAQVLKVMELPAFEEALPGIWHLTLDFWLGQSRQLHIMGMVWEEFSGWSTPSIRCMVKSLN
ncbi:hypothetical protein M1N93_01635 [Dehalococcoidia bacterium]|nr:hypothetical protein [Dehalococcoidia bacterium]